MISSFNENENPYSRRLPKIPRPNVLLYISLIYGKYVLCRDTHTVGNILPALVPTCYCHS